MSDHHWTLPFHLAHLNTDSSKFGFYLDGLVLFSKVNMDLIRSNDVLTVCLFCFVLFCFALLFLLGTGRSIGDGWHGLYTRGLKVRMR